MKEVLSMQKPPNSQQPYYPQQPYQQQYTQPPGYPRQQPQYPQHPHVAPKKKPGKSLLIGVGVVIFALFVCAVASHGRSSSRATTAATTSGASQSQQAQTVASNPQTWQTVQTFKGNGEQKTAVFSVPDDWKITWTCNPSSFMGGSYNVIVTVYNSDGTLSDLAINAMCKSGATSGTTEEHQAGNVYLDISSEGDWGLTVQKLK